MKSDQKIRDNADLATCCLRMVSIHATVNHAPVHVYTMPWEALDTAAELYRAGATEIALHASFTDPWYWSPTLTGKLYRKAKRAHTTHTEAR